VCIWLVFLTVYHNFQLRECKFCMNMSAVPPHKSWPVTSILWTYWNRVVSKGINCAVENPQASETWVAVGQGGTWWADEHRKQITCRFPSKFQTSNKLLSVNRAVFACGSWTFPLITPPQFRLVYIILGAIITVTPQKFRSFGKAEPNSQFCEKCFHNNLIRIWVSLVCKLSGTPD
jgi:hypothetical protein